MTATAMTKAEDEHIGKGKAAAIGEDNEMLDIFDGIVMTITPTKDSSAIEVAKLRREAQQKDVQLAYLQTENAALRETLEESRETMRRLLTRAVARQTQIQHQFNDENIEIAEMWQSLIVSAGDRFLDKNSRVLAKSVQYMQQAKAKLASNEEISHPSLATEEVANPSTATTKVTNPSTATEKIIPTNPNAPTPPQNTPTSPTEYDQVPDEDLFV